MSVNLNSDNTQRAYNHNEEPLPAYQMDPAEIHWAANVQAQIYSNEGLIPPPYTSSPPSEWLLAEFDLIQTCYLSVANGEIAEEVHKMDLCLGTADPSVVDIHLELERAILERTHDDITEIFYDLEWEESAEELSDLSESSNVSGSDATE